MPDSPASRKPFVAIVLGVCSGPVAGALAYVCLNFGLDLFGAFSGVIVLGGAFVFGISAALDFPVRRRDRTFTIIAMVAPVLWSAGIFFYIDVAFRQAVAAGQLP
jgi:hypothetical protein